MSLTAGLGLGRLTNAPGAAHVVGPIVATVLAGHVAASAARRLRVPLAAVLAAGGAAVALAAVWALLLSSTDHGVPTPAAWRVLVHQVAQAGAVIRSHPTPVPATTGVVLCIALGAGLVAALGRAVWAYEETRRPRGGWRTTRPLLALVPSFGIVCYASLLSSQVDRVPGAIWYLISVFGFVVAADRLGAPARNLATMVGGVAPATALAALAVVVPVALSPGLASLRVDALPFTQATGSGGGAGFGGDGSGSGGVAASGVRAIDLIDDLRAIITTRSGDVMFSANSPVPTYWQVGVLTHFVDDAWVPDPTTLAAAQSFAIPTQNFIDGIPILPDPTPGATFTADITIADLESSLLPVPPTTVSVSDVTATILPGVGALHPFETPPGLVYSATARTPVAPAPTAKASSLAGIPPDALTPYVSLPPLPSRVVALAHHIVGGATTPMAKALAIVRWFTSGRFRYTLSPPAPGGTDPLTSFLFSTRAGFCQQFAAAYAVLARLDGLPTRVAVGFTTGALVGRDRYQVTGADAHVWPEVYLGPSVGWTSFEPTPAISGDPNGVGVLSAGGRRRGPRHSGCRPPRRPRCPCGAWHSSRRAPCPRSPARRAPDRRGRRRGRAAGPSPPGWPWASRRRGRRRWSACGPGDGAGAPRAAGAAATATPPPSWWPSGARPRWCSTGPGWDGARRRPWPNTPSGCAPSLLSAASRAPSRGRPRSRPPATIRRRPIRSWGRWRRTRAWPSWPPGRATRPTPAARRTPTTPPACPTRCGASSCGATVRAAWRRASEGAGWAYGGAPVRG